MSGTLTYLIDYTQNLKGQSLSLPGLKSNGLGIHWITDQSVKSEDKTFKVAYEGSELGVQETSEESDLMQVMVP